MNANKKLYSYSQPGSFRLVANHGEKVLYILVILGVLYTYQDLKGEFLITVAILIIGLFFILAIIGKFIAKVIWRIDINFSEENIYLNLCRKASPIQIGFNKIDQIKVSGPIVFLVGKKKYYYSTNQYEEILKTLRNVKNITWGKMCDILGPEKSIRNSIDSK